MGSARINRLLAGAVCAALVAGSAVAQPSRGARRNPGGMVRMMLPVEQTLGYLALDEAMALTDAQLVAVRQALRDVGREREALAGDVAGGDVDRQALVTRVGKLRADMFDRVKAVLDDRQDALLDAYLARLQERRERFQRGGRGVYQRGDD